MYSVLHNIDARTISSVRVRGGKRKTGTENEEVNTPAMLYLRSDVAATHIDPELIEQIFGMPKGLKKLVRVFKCGVGNLLHACMRALRRGSQL